MKTLLSLFCLLSLSLHAHASRIVSISPLTSQIILVHLDDGLVRHPRAGEPRDSIVIVQDSLLTNLAAVLSNYGITSDDDAAYFTAKIPTLVGRKSKPTEHSSICHNWDWSYGCTNDTVDHVKEHWLYLYLPTALQLGKTYTVQCANLSISNAVHTFTYNYKTQRSECIHINQVGYTPTAQQKFAYLYHWQGDAGALDLSSFAGTPFHLVDSATQAVVFTDTIRFRKSKLNVETYQGGTPNGNFVGADVYECNFSSFSTSGTFYLAVPGMGCSWPLHVAADVYDDVYRKVVRGLYNNRSGIALLPQHTAWPRPAPHNPQLTPGFAGKLKYTSARYFDLQGSDSDPADTTAIQAGYLGTLDSTWGWYQDAGDWDGYYWHNKVPMQLMTLFEMSDSTKHKDNALNIPESGNTLPDVLDEARWLIRFYYRLKKETEARGYTSGGVGGSRIFGDHWGTDQPVDGALPGHGSWQDVQRDWYVTGQDPWMTYLYAGMCAQLAYILQRHNFTDPENINWLAEATNAYTWASNNTMLYDDTTRFDNLKLAHAKMYADVALLRATAQPAYAAGFTTAAQVEILPNSGFDEDAFARCFASLVYLLTPQNTDAAIRQHIVAQLRETVDFANTAAAERACRWAGNWWYPMLVGQGTTPLIAPHVYYHYAIKDSNAAAAQEVLNAIHTTADYFLGTNPLNYCWVTGVGQRNQTTIFKMDWYYGSNPTQVPDGYTSYGMIARSYPWPMGPWNTNFAYRYIYPQSDTSWPGHEQYFEQRPSPLATEFTVWQQNANNALVYGYLASNTLFPTQIASLAVNPAAITLFPNPTTGDLYINANDLVQNVDIYNYTGTCVAQFYNTNHVTLPASLSTGMYIAKVRCANAVYTSKFMLSK